MKKMLVLGLFACIFSQNTAQSSYKLPSDDVVKIVDAPSLPASSVSPTRKAVLLTEYNAQPSVALLARPFLKLGGIRVDPELNARQRTVEFTGFSIIWLDENKTVKIDLPAGAKPSGVPAWSPDGLKIAFGNDTKNGVEIWVADAKTGRSKRLGDLFLNDVLGAAFSWMEDSKRLAIRKIPTDRGAAPVQPRMPEGPSVEETAGKSSKVMTYQDLLKNEFDAKNFEFFAASQIAVVDAESGKIKQILGEKGLIQNFSFSPDENYLLVTTLKRPFSYRVQASNFARKTEIWSAKTGLVAKVLTDLGVTDEIPPQGVVIGPRGFDWQALHPARITFAEALDGGDPKKKVDLRDEIFVLDAPFSAEKKSILKTQYRFQGMDWTADRDIVLLEEYDRDRRWATTWRVDLNDAASKTKLFDLSVNDGYNDPGTPVTEKNAAGEWVFAQDGDWAFFNNQEGATPDGNFPKLTKINLKTGEKEVVWQCRKGEFERFVAFTDRQNLIFLTRQESPTEPPNLFLTKPRSAAASRKITDFKDPHPEFSGLSKEIVQYKRADGTPLNGTLYLPPNYKKGERLPVFIWAYPLEYSDASTAGQVRGSTNTFTYLKGDSPLFFLTKGWAVLMDATMPVVGDPETMNNTFIEQITSSGRAAIDFLDSIGVADRSRIGVGGHSYGAFMTANLLAHSDDYAFGIARSGAYNRTLTPFGFQSERRSYWEAKEIYNNVSPFNFADKIKTPLLLIHGEADNNPGTFTLQSERLFQAIKGNGGTARLVLLPHEAHGYRGRESILHVLAESFEWADRFGKGEVKKP